MEKEIRKKMHMYGIAAILLAITMGAVFANFEGFRRLINPTPTPTPTLAEGFLKKFASEEELKNFLQTSSEETSYDYYYGTTNALSPKFAFTEQNEAGIPEYSTTNVQVAGVDEADIVKTNGTCMYVVSGNKVTLLKAYPASEAEILSQLSFNGTIEGIFLYGNNKLAVTGKTGGIIYYKDLPYMPTPVYPYTSNIINDKTFVYVYDVSNGYNPVLTRNFSITGYYGNSRMINEYLYLVVNEPIYLIHDILILPKIYSGNTAVEIKATDIYYTWIHDYFYTTTIIAINLQNDDQEPTYKTFLLGSASCMYVSLDNMYITYSQYSYKTADEEKTIIFRIHIEAENVECEAGGNIPGRVLNQFSMDEYHDYFRIATTTWTDVTKHHVYVLNMNLTIVGELKNIGVRETLYAVRFIGDRGYVVTFLQTDPLFVIDLADPTNPQLKGELTIPGYSSYLHPYDENHIIGVGREGSHVKISLFDVSNASSPKEIDKYIINNSWYSDSPALYDYKAFLFNRTRSLLVIPVTIEEPYVAMPEKEGWSQYSYWQGAYVFNISLTGFALEGKITHEGTIEPQYSYYLNSYSVKRSLYINNVLYTISEAKVKMNNLYDLTDINEIPLP